jgi:SAM-dependent methyltransferase
MSSVVTAPREYNKLRIEDRAAHDWYRFVLSFPAHLVRDYISRFQVEPTGLVLDPFCGTGTTLVECKKLGIRSVGIESNPMASFASQVKVDWSIDPKGLNEHADHIAKRTWEKLDAAGIGDSSHLPLFTKERRCSADLRPLPEEKANLLLKDSISPLPLHKTLVLIDTINEDSEKAFRQHERLALAKAIVCGISNLHFGPEVGVSPPKPDAPVVQTWLNYVRRMAEDLRALGPVGDTQSIVKTGDSRELLSLLQPNSVEAVITSPPYPNEKDYTRTTRLESVLLGFINNKHDLRLLKKNLLRSNTRGVYKADTDDLLVEENGEVQRIANAIEARRIELGKTSGFERMYARVTKLYFGGMVRHLSDLRTILRPGARLGYVVGDQASYLRIMIRTGEILADIAKSLGYELIDIDLFRTRLSTATKEQLREEIVLLKWPGKS